jgi:hypothetical protein
VKTQSFGPFHTEVGVGFGSENGLAGKEDFEGARFSVEGVWQIGPLVRVLTHNGGYFFISSSISLGLGALVGTKQATWVWDTGLGTQ